MPLSYTIIPAGDLTGMLHFRIAADSSFDPEQTLNDIQHYATTQPTIVAIYPSGAPEESIRDFLALLFEHDKKATTILVTPKEKPTRLWYDVSRVILTVPLKSYQGTPATEVHLAFDPETDFDTFPIIAPHSPQCSLYVHTVKDHYSELIAWARRMYRPIGITTKPFA